MKALDLTNRRFGKLVALQRAPKRNDKYTRWICQCDCGNICEVRTDYLTSQHTTSCGCEKQKCFFTNSITNQKFGKLTVLEQYGPDSKLCICDCGNKVIVKTYNLMNGNTQSCGCLKSKGELKINTLLDKMLITYKTQYSFDDCRFPDTNRLAYFDYAIFHNDKLLCLIEYDGAQHYYGWNYQNTSLDHIKQYDQYKNDYCNNHNIPLIRIPFYDLDNITEDYLKNKLEEITDDT